ncbi:MAG: hypothetical protein ABSB35_25345 [Bryobacteraceae bacterium]|jgi:serine/threonine-protein kinase
MGTEGAEEPFFSPDGKSVAFFAGGKLKKIAMSGGPPVTICDLPGTRFAAFGASWSSTDDIVFAVGSAGLMHVPAGGGTPQVLLKSDPAKPAETYSSPQFLPGEKNLLFTVRASDNWDEAQVIARRLDTGDQRTLIKGATDARYVPTGYLVYMQNAVLMAAPFDAGRAQLTGSPVAMLDGVMQSVNMPNATYESGMGQFAFSASGSLIYASGGIAPFTGGILVRVDRQGVPTELKTPKGRYLHGRVSPDGQRFAASRGAETNRTSDIWTIDINTGSSTRLTSDGAGGLLLWSPDGKRIIFRGKNGQLLSIAADGSGSVESVTASTSAIPASWSGVGRRLAYLELHDGQNQIWTRPMPGPGEPQRFAESRFRLWDADFSPDGHWITYSTNESGTDEVYVQAFPSGEKHRISTAGGVNPAWARNGRELFYIQPARSADKDAMMAVDFAMGGTYKIGAPHQLFEGPLDVTAPTRNYDVTPDGHFIMLRSSEEPPDQSVTKLNVVLNWFDELKKRAPRSAH